MRRQLLSAIALAVLIGCGGAGGSGSETPTTGTTNGSTTSTTTGTTTGAESHPYQGSYSGVWYFSPGPHENITGTVSNTGAANFGAVFTGQISVTGDATGLSTGHQIRRGKARFQSVNGIQYFKITFDYPVGGTSYQYVTIMCPVP